MKNIVVLMLLSVLLEVKCVATPMSEPPISKPPISEMRKVDKMLTKELNLSEDQLRIIRKNHAEFRKKMDDIISQMEKEQIKIRNIYLSGIPSYQANIRSASMKAKLVILKQQADFLRTDNRNKFESVLTPEQLQKFVQIKQDLKKTNR